jgi:hypothetical protein
MEHTPQCLAGIHACTCSYDESEWSREYTPEEFDASERFWLGPKNPKKHLVYHMQSNSTQQKWLAVSNGVELDPNYSEFSIRIHNPKARSLSFIYRTIAILPKQYVRDIYNLIGEYLNDHDNDTKKHTV